jgi:hypothetical protein
MQQVNSSIMTRLKELEATPVPQEDSVKKKTSKKMRTLREDNKQLVGLAKQLQQSLIDSEHDYDALDAKYQDLVLASSDYEEQTRALTRYTHVLMEHLSALVEI